MANLRIRGSQDPQHLLIFAPFADVLVHSMLERMLATEFAAAERRVTVLRCSGLLANWCIPMSAGCKSPEADLPKAGSSCKRCISRRDALDRHKEYEILDIKGLISKESLKLIGETIESIPDSDLADFTWRDIPVGKFLLYDSLIRYKADSLRYSNQISAFRRELLSAAIAVQVGADLSSWSDASAVLVHSFEYGINRSFCEAVMRFHSVSTFSFKNDGFGPMRTNTLRLSLTTAAPNRPEEARCLSAMRSPLVRSEAQMISAFLIERIKAVSSWTYSNSRSRVSASTIRNHFSTSDQVVLVLGSSPDELVAQKSAGLISADVNTTTDKDLLGQVFRVARIRPDLSFVFRPHPRLFPNRRESFASELSASIYGDSGSLPPNVVIQEPEDDMGLYDLLMVADVVWSHRSNTAIEALLLGIPTFASTESSLSVAPESVLRNVSGASDTEVANEIDEALSIGWQVSSVVGCARWIAASHYRTTWSVPHRQRVQNWLPQLSHYNLWRLYLSVRFFRIALRREGINRLWGVGKLSNPVIPIHPDHSVSVSLSKAVSDFHLSELQDEDKDGERELIRGILKKAEYLLGPWDGKEGAIKGLASWVGSNNPKT